MTTDRLKKYRIETLTTKELLRLPLRSLSVSLEDSPWFCESRQILFSELAARDIRFQPHFWLSTEWFVPDGHTGIAVSLFSIHPRLRKLESMFLGQREVNTSGGFLKFLRHEMGHAVDNAFALRKMPHRREVFGNPRIEYPSCYTPQLYSRHYIDYLGTGYGQSHPDEDFAETFAAMLDSDFSLPKLTQKGSQKVRFMQSVFAYMASNDTFKSTQARVEPIDRCDMTLREILLRRQRFNFSGFEFSKVQEFKQIVDITPRGRRFRIDNELTENVQEYVSALSEGLGRPKYEASLILRRLKCLLKVRGEYRDQYIANREQLKDGLIFLGIEACKGGQYQIPM